MVRVLRVFIDAYRALCRRYDLSLIPDDGYTPFVIEPFEEWKMAYVEDAEISEEVVSRELGGLLVRNVGDAPIRVVVWSRGKAETVTIPAHRDIRAPRVSFRREVTLVRRAAGLVELRLVPSDGAQDRA